MKKKLQNSHNKDEALFLQSNNEYLSTEVFRVLDALGSSQSMIRYRRENYKNFSSSNDWSMTFDIGSFEMTRIVVGSKGEGLTSVYESDVDLMYLIQDIVCVDCSAEISAKMKKDALIFAMDTDNCYPGYCRLKLSSVREGEKHSDFANVVSVLRNTDQLKKNFVSEGPIDGDVETELFLKKPGLAVPVFEEGMDIDNVVAYRCFCPGILLKWAERPRNYNWPSHQLKSKVISTEACLVAVGSKLNGGGTDEWRICFNVAERAILEGLNETQTKLYILLKIVVKEFLKPKRKEVNSYIMKNIVFWMAEIYPETLFQEGNLCKCLMIALKSLEESLLIDFLPYYMIPERNILGETKMPAAVKTRLQSRLKKLIKTGPTFLLQYPKLKVALGVPIGRLNLYRHFRDGVERLSLFKTFGEDEDDDADEMLNSAMQMCSPVWRTLSVFKDDDVESMFKLLSRCILR